MIIVHLLHVKSYNNNNKMLNKILIFLITLVSFHNPIEGSHHHLLLQSQHHHNHQQQQQMINLEANYELIENDSRYISYQGKLRQFVIKKKFQFITFTVSI